MRLSAKILVFTILLASIPFTIGDTKRSSRVKRQNPGNALIDAVFQVPIQTLSAVGTLVKTSRPIVMQVRQRVWQYLVSSNMRPQRFRLRRNVNEQDDQKISPDLPSVLNVHRRLGPPSRRL